MRRIAAVLLLVLIGMAGGCSEPAQTRFQLAPDVEKPPRNVVIFFADGMDNQRLHEMLAAGLLPNIRRTFCDGGVEVADAICSMPSITYPNCSTIVTGRFPGHHGILGNFWFDRDKLKIHYYMTLDTARDVNADLVPPTIYTMLADHLTVSILAQTHKDATVSFDLKNVFDLGWIFGEYDWVNRRVGETFVEVADLANRVKRWPTVVMTYYPGVDEIGHRHGPDSREFTAVLTELDQIVANTVDAVDRLGLSEQTYFVLLADHGMVPIRPGQDFDFVAWLRHEKQVKVLNRPLTEADYVGRLETLQAYDAIATVDAGRVAMVHLRGESWPRKPGHEGVRAWATAEPAVHDLPAVEMVAARAGLDRAAVWSREGSFVVERKAEDDRKLYRVLNYRGDPLRLGDDRARALAAMVRDGWHASREWLAASAASRYPDLVPQVVEMFDSPHTGDLVVFAAEGWLLYPGEYAGHGSTLHRDMHVPLFFAGPGLPAGTRISRGRLVDLVPTLLGLLGEAGRLERFSPIDGTDLSSQLRAAPVPEPVLPRATPLRPSVRR